MEEPITQSHFWKNLQDDLNETSFEETGENFHYLAILKKTPIGNYLYLPYGPVVKDQISFNKALKSLKTLAKSKNAIFVRVEPQNPSLKPPKNAIKSKDLNPKETWLLDLTGTEDDLKKKLPSRLLRYYKNAEKTGLTIKTSKNPEDIEYLLDLQKALAKEKGISTFSENYLKTELEQPFATLYLVVWEETVIAAGLVFDYKGTRYNLQGAQSEEGKKLHATGILTIELIKDAKKEGKKIFDFWGIAPENAPKDHPWAGFTNFKKTFSGYEKDYLGTYDIVENPLKYRLYQLTRKLNRLIRKIKWDLEA